MNLLIVAAARHGRILSTGCKHSQRQVLVAAAATVGSSMGNGTHTKRNFSSLDRRKNNNKGSPPSHPLKSLSSPPGIPPHIMMTNTSILSSPPPPLSSPSSSSSPISLSSSSSSSSSEVVFERTVYVHPLSQIILEYFQDYRSEWIISRGLDRALTLHRDGSFELSLSEEDFRIWTSYDDKDKKHWMTVQYNKGGCLHERYLLQDNLLPSWHMNRKSLPERIHMAIEEMIVAVNRMDILLDDHVNDDDNDNNNNNNNNNPSRK